MQIKVVLPLTFSILNTRGPRRVSIWRRKTTTQKWEVCLGPKTSIPLLTMDSIYLMDSRDNRSTCPSTTCIILQAQEAVLSETLPKTWFSATVSPADPWEEWRRTLERESSLGTACMSSYLLRLAHPPSKKFTSRIRWLASTKSKTFLTFILVNQAQSANKA